MNRLLVKDDAYWHHKAKKNWYRDGDRQTKFFHAEASSRKKENRLTSLHGNHRNKVTDNHAISSIAKIILLIYFRSQTTWLPPLLALSVPQLRMMSMCF